MRKSTVLCCTLSFPNRSFCTVNGALSVPPSLMWDGADGSWSTFTVRIGTPDPQLVRLLPGTSANAGNSIWAVLPQGCTVAAPNLTDCANQRGNLFAPNQSSTWSTERLANAGLYSLTTFEEGKLGLGGNAYYGFDTIQLGYDGSGLPSIPDQLIGGIAGYDFWLGSLGLSPLGFNFSDQNDQVPSLLSTLRDRRLIASTTWAYTAGASYHEPPVFGSLTFGGYDELRYDETNFLDSVPSGVDSSRDLLIGIKSISHDTLGSTPLLSDGIYAFIDSMVTSLWLPVEVCHQFEQAFNLTWNSTAQMYLLSNDVHSALLSQNPTIKLTLGPTSDIEGEFATVKLPYAAFDLTIRPPFVQTETRYFPLQRAQNSTQYTLGRVFLQEAYVIANYDRSVFSVGQAKFPTPASATRVVNITAPGTAPEMVEIKSKGLSKGALAGTLVGVGLAVILSMLAAIVWCRRHKRLEQLQTANAEKREYKNCDDVTGKSDISIERRAELDDHDPAIYQVEAGGRDRPELPGQSGRFEAQELQGLRKPSELDGREKSRSGILQETTEDGRQIFELHA